MFTISLSTTSAIETGILRMQNILLLQQQKQLNSPTNINTNYSNPACSYCDNLEHTAAKFLCPVEQY